MHFPMKRKNFLKTLFTIPIAGYTMNFNEFLNEASSGKESQTMPVIFAGHGSPMNAIENNEFSRSWSAIGKQIPKPGMILSVSAHWETRGTYVTGMEKPQTIHDFGGFPQALFDMEYPAPGNSHMAKEISDSFNGMHVGIDQSWGLDHGTWSILVHMFPKADIPVVQLSLDYGLEPQAHFKLATQLSQLREKGVLILGSGNLVHNLRLVDWEHQDSVADWALEANDTFKRLISQGDYQQLIDYRRLGRAVQLAVPTPEHFLPLIYTMAIRKKDEEFSFFNDKSLMGSLSMTSVIIG
jgi:4,5-DOPA dioxygenase extradiol